MATLTRERTDSKVDARRIDAAYAAATAACAAAYSAQPVEQKDGTMLQLCWHGRIARGYERLAAARQSKDAAAIETITTALRSLERRFEAASAEAERAAAAWAALATAAGQTVDPMSCYPPTCTCEGCQTALAHHDHNEARGKYSDALYALLAPNPIDRPPLYTLLEDFGKSEQDRDRFWAAMKTIYDSAKTYDSACKAAGVAPNWRAAMAPWVEE